MAKETKESKIKKLEEKMFIGAVNVNAEILFLLWVGNFKNKKVVENVLKEKL